MSLFALVFAAIVLVAVAAIGIYNGMISNHNAVVRAWSDVLVQERQKGRVLPALENELKGYKEFEKGTLETVTKLRQGLEQLDWKGEHSTEMLAETRKLTSQLMSQLKVTVEAYPELKSSDLAQRYMKELVEQNNNVSAAIRIFNSNVESFNTGIETFPNSIIARKFLKHARVTPFSDSTASAEFEYNPNLN